MYYRNSKVSQTLAKLLGILGQHNGSSQQLKFEVVEKQQTGHKFVQQCSFFQSEARTSKFADQADKIAHFTNPFYFPKETLNSLEVNL